MNLNIIDIINKNEFFLKKIFPNGLENIQIGRLNLFFEDKIEFSIYTNQKPYIPVKKWGTWGKNYTTIVFKVSGHFLRKIDIKNWQNNKLENCSINVEKIDDSIKLFFEGENWSMFLELETLIHQDSSVYIDDKLI